MADEEKPKAPEKKTSSFALPLVLLVLVVAAWGGGYFWYTTKPSTYRSPLGFQVDLPNGWTARSDEDNTMIARGDFPDGGGGSARAVLLALDPADLRAGLSDRGPDEFEETEIGGKKAAVAVYDDGTERCLEAVVTGKESVRMTFRCDAKIFEANRARFEKSARSIRWLEK